MGMTEKSSEAIASYKKVIEIDPKHTVAWNMVGNAYYGQRNFSEAIGHYKKALDINPNYANTWYNLGAVYRDQGNYSKAISSFKKALEINPNDADAWNNLGRVSRIRSRKVPVRPTLDTGAFAQPFFQWFLGCGRFFS